jgi:hypothetical protein
MISVCVRTRFGFLPAIPLQSCSTPVLPVYFYIRHAGFTTSTNFACFYLEKAVGVVLHLILYNDLTGFGYGVLRSRRQLYCFGQRWRPVVMYILH